MANIKAFIKTKPRTNRCGVLWERLGYLCHNLLENFRMFSCNLGEDFAIKGNVFLFEGTNEFTVGKSLGESGVDADVEESAHVTLFVTSVSKGVGTSMRNSFVCLAFLCRTSKTIAFYLLEDISTGLECINSFFYACHRCMY